RVGASSAAQRKRLLEWRQAPSCLKALNRCLEVTAEALAAEATGTKAAPPSTTTTKTVPHRNITQPPIRTAVSTTHLTMPAAISAPTSKTAEASPTTAARAPTTQPLTRPTRVAIAVPSTTAVLSIAEIQAVAIPAGATARSRPSSSLHSTLYSLPTVSLQPQLRHHHLQVFPRLALLPRVAQQKRGVIGHCDLRSAAGVPLPTQRCQRLPHSKQVRRCGRSQRDDDLRLHHIDLPQQELRARRRFHWLGCTVLRRAALHNVRDVYLLTRDAHRGDHVVQQLTGLADKRQTARVFIRARPFADEHQLCIGITISEHDVMPPRIGQRTARAVANVGTNRNQSGGAFCGRNARRRQWSEGVKGKRFRHGSLEFWRKFRARCKRRRRLRFHRRRGKRRRHRCGRSLRNRCRRCRWRRNHTLLHRLALPRYESRCKPFGQQHAWLVLAIQIVDAHVAQ